MVMGAWLAPSGTSQGAAVAPATTQFHWQDLSLCSTESSRGEKLSACFSVLGVACSSPGRTSYPSLAYGSPTFSVCALVGSIASGHHEKNLGNHRSRALVPRALPFFLPSFFKLKFSSLSLVSFFRT